MKKTFIKDYFIVFIFGIILMIGFGYFVNAINENGLFFVEQPDADEIQQILGRFQRTTEPVSEINFFELYGNGQQFQILHPILSVKKGFFQKSSQSCSECQPHQVDIIDFDSKKNKRDLLSKYVYQNVPLPENFFSEPPYVDQWGMSYAYFLILYQTSHEDQVGWVLSHLSFFKISELEEVLNKYHIKHGQFSILATLSDREVESIVRGDKIILTSKYVFVKDQTQYGFSPLNYLVYNNQEFYSALRKEKYEASLHTTDNERCLSKVGNTCWNHNSSELNRYFKKYAILIFIFLGIVIFVFYIFFVRSFYRKQKIQLRNRLSLQILSHEFRTPVSSMLLMMERVLAKQSQMDIEGQDMLTRLSGEIFKLQRIIEMSKSYLQAEGKKIKFKLVQIDSINTWMQDFANEIDDLIQIKLLDYDKSITVDPFWFKFILSNLIQNAFIHGLRPVHLILEDKNNKITVSVVDAGNCEFKTLSEMTEAYSKRAGSSGMGLGLSMIHLVAQEQNMNFRYAQNPTTFSITLNQGVEK